MKESDDGNTGGNENRINRRSVLKGVGAAGTAGLVGLAGFGAATGTVAAQETTPRSEVTGSGNVFLGGDFIELGIRGDDGGFGPNEGAPESFFGSDRGDEPEHSNVDFPGEIGLYADIDGFANTGDPQFRYEYFLPGQPEERWSAGYGGAESGRTMSNGRVTDGNPSGADETNVPTTVELTESDPPFIIDLSTTFDGTLQIDQTYSFDPSDRFAQVDVTLENVGEESISDVRYQRSVDPDNGQDTGCDFTTKNTIRNQPPESDEALIQAEIYDEDPCDLRDVTTAPIFYYSTEEFARVSSGSSSGGLVPDPVVYAEEDYDNSPAEGTTKTEDVYMAITFDVGTLDPDESETLTFFIALTDDIEDTIDDIGSGDCVPAEEMSREDREAGRRPCEQPYDNKSEKKRNRSRDSEGNADTERRNRSRDDTGDGGSGSETSGSSREDDSDDDDDDDDSSGEGSGGRGRGSGGTSSGSGGRGR